MSASRYETSIVIPSYNEEKRLGATLDALQTLVTNDGLNPVVVREVIVVDDGSSDFTSRVANEHAARLPGFKVIRYEPNHGKGYAVRCGMKASRSDWILIADADMSTPWIEAAKLANVATTSQAMIAIASRDLGDSKIVRHQSFARENLGKTFNYFVRLLTRLEFRDTQCGFKLINARAIAPILNQLEIDRFAWDVEVLMLARAAGLGISEVAVQWEHKDDSRVSLFRDGLAMVASVIAIRYRLATAKLLHRKSNA